MRRFAFILIVLAFFLTACSVSREENIRGNELVGLYTAINDNVKYSEMSFSGSDAATIADLVQAECPQGVGTEFIRATFESASSTLTVYTDSSGKNITCSVLKPKVTKQIELKSHDLAPDNETAVVVNGRVIAIDQIRFALSQLPSNTPQDENTLNLVVNQAINDELLRQQAENVKVTGNDIAKTRKEVLAASNLTEATVSEALSAQNITEETFDQRIQQQAKLNKLLNTRLKLDDVQVSEEDARNFYLQNPNQFMQSEQAVARFLVISSEGKTLQQGQRLAQEVSTLINSTDFCQLVQKYSDDANSKANCGLYVIPRGAIDANVELAAFTTPANQTSVVTTGTGIYFVQTLQVTPQQVVPYAQVSHRLMSTLRESLFQQRLNLYLATLRNEATITSYLG